jgi:hypothetical protein
MVEILEIRSSSGPEVLTIAHKGHEQIQVGVTAVGMTASAPVYHLAGDQLALYFRGLAVAWKGWKGEKEWRSVEGTFRFSATMDRTGHVELGVHLENGVPFDWRVQMNLRIEAGQLEMIAQRVLVFEHHSHDL